MKKIIRRVLIFFVAGILLFLVSACGNSNASAEPGITLKAGQTLSAAEDIFGGAENGWSTPEGNHTWSNGYLSILKFNYGNEFIGGVNFSIKMGSFVNVKNPIMKVTVKANNVIVKELDFTESLSGGNISIDVSPEILKKNASQLILSFELPNAAKPSEIGWNNDQRRLGIWISEILVNKISTPAK